MANQKTLLNWADIQTMRKDIWQLKRKSAVLALKQEFKPIKKETVKEQLKQPVKKDIKPEVKIDFNIPSAEQIQRQKYETAQPKMEAAPATSVKNESTPSAPAKSNIISNADLKSKAEIQQPLQKFEPKSIIKPSQSLPLEIKEKERKEKAPLTNEEKPTTAADTEQKKRKGFMEDIEKWSKEN